MISSFMSELWEMKVPSAVQSTGADSPTITSSVTMCYNVLQCVTTGYNVTPAIKMMYSDSKVNSCRMLRM